MAKETMRCKIERLEKELNSANEIIQKLNNEILQFQENADKDFNNSPDFIQLNKKVKELELKLKVTNDKAIHNEKKMKNKYELQITELKEENLTLKLQIAKANEDIKIRNERGAGRKKQFDEERFKKIQKFRAEGMTVKSIAERLNTSMSTVNRYLKKRDEVEC